MGNRKLIFCYCLLVITCMWFLVGWGSSASWCFRKAALFYCGTPLAFHILMLLTAALLLWFSLLTLICVSVSMLYPLLHLAYVVFFSHRARVSAEEYVNAVQVHVALACSSSAEPAVFIGIITVVFYVI